MQWLGFVVKGSKRWPGGANDDKCVKSATAENRLITGISTSTLITVDDERSTYGIGEELLASYFQYYKSFVNSPSLQGHLHPPSSAPRKQKSCSPRQRPKQKKQNAKHTQPANKKKRGCSNQTERVYICLNHLDMGDMTEEQMKTQFVTHDQTSSW